MGESEATRGDQGVIRLDWPMSFGLFLPPRHNPRQNPTLALGNDLELIAYAERLGYAEAWVGEHHSTGHELIGANDLFIAAAAGRTTRIQLGTGVVSLPYHHPFMVATRHVLLDHLTRGRTMLGIGPGSLPTDAVMFGVDMARQRAMMAESLEAINALLTSDEPITRKTDWFTLQDAKLQLKPYSHPCFEIAVAAFESPVGPTLAGQYGYSLLSLGATQAVGFAALSGHWEVMEEQGAKYGTHVDRRNWRCSAPCHIAETFEEAQRDVAYGLPGFQYYTRNVTARSVGEQAVDAKEPTPVDEMVERVNTSGYGLIGTPDDAIAWLQRLVEATDGGFGTYIMLILDWASPEATRRSMELFAREVFPAFQGSTVPLIEAEESAINQRGALYAPNREAIKQYIDDFEAQKRRT